MVIQQWGRSTVNQKALSARQQEPAAPQPPSCVLGRGQGSQHTPGHVADPKVLSRGTAGLSLPAQIQMNAATRGNRLQLPRHFPYGSPPPPFTGKHPAASPSPELQSPTNAEAALYLLPPSPRSFQQTRSPGTVQSPRFGDLLPKHRQPQPPLPAGAELDRC